MSNVLINKTKLDALAVSVAEKSGESVPLTVDEMREAVNGISGGSANLQTKSETYTPTTSQQTDTITPDAGYDGMDEVDVTVDAVPIMTQYGSGVYGRYTTVNGNRKWLARGDVEAYEDGYLAFDNGDTFSTEEVDYNAIASGTSVTPTESAQTIGGSNYMMEGAVTVNAIPSNYVGSGITQRTSSDLTASGATVTVPAGYYENNASKSVASGSATAPNTISGTSASVSVSNNTVTLSKTVSVTPSVSAGYVASGTAGNSSVSLSGSMTTQSAQTIYPSTSDQTISSGRYLSGTQTIKGVAIANLSASNIKSGVTITVGDSADADRITSVTGTYTGGGGKNTQVYFGYASRTANSYGATSVTLTVAKTGTYKVSWTAWRGSSSGTMGTNLHVNSSSGTNQQTWTGTYGQCITLNNQSLQEDDVLTLYATSGSNSRTVYVGNLIIEEQ